MDQIIKTISDRSPHRITLSRHSGEQKEFILRRCGEADLDEIMTLQRKISDELHNPDIYSLVEEAEILESLEEDYCFGVYDVAADHRLVAFTVMIANRVSHRNYGSYVGYPPERQRKCVSMEITVVDDPCRGFGMQRLFVRLREGVARELGANEAMVTIGPENKYSLDNLLASGYEIIETRPLYEGAMRHILRKTI